MYIPRIADSELKQRLESSGAVVVEGPRACGKTETARQIAGSEVLLDTDDQARRAIEVDPALVLEGKTPRLIDEWQIEPTIWNSIRREVDSRQQFGQFVLTGSSVPADDITRHTGAGRFSRLRLRTMSLFESGHSSGVVSLHDLFDGKYDQTPDSGFVLKDVIERLCIGGWPRNLELSSAAALRASGDYLEEIQRVDIVRVDGIRRDPDNVGRVLRSLARNIATTVSTRTLALDAGGADGALDDDTVRGYLSALGRLMVFEEQPAWAPHLRSRSILRKSGKRHLTDPSLAVAALGASPESLLQDFSLLGCLFESLVYRDLVVYAQSLDARVFHYRDNTDVEVDAIVENRQGQWCAFEVKLGAGQLDHAAATLLRFRDRIDVRKRGEPSMMGIITSSGYGYQRKDGIAVIPIASLGP